MAITRWMSWEGGVDLCGATAPGMAAPNVIVHVGRVVQTPAGSASSAMIFFAPDPAKPPEFFAFVSTDEKVGRYFGPNVFAGTPFEKAPVLIGKFEIVTEAKGVGAKITVAGRLFETWLSDLGPTEIVRREPTATSPFTQLGIEAAAMKASLKIDGKEITLHLPKVGISGGPAAVSAPAGLYVR